MEEQPRPRAFTKYAYGVLAYTMLVILWGAFVRATGSGAGCGSHWPLCNGEVLPREPETATLIEFTHRVTSGLSLASVAAMLVWAFRAYPRGHRVRRFTVLAMLFLALEAVLGAGLVLLKFVAHNASAGRAVYLSAHLLNTQVLLAMLALAAWYSHAPRAARAAGSRPRAVTLSLPAALLLSVTGALAALGDTLLLGSAAGDGGRMGAAAQDLIRLRLIHPFFAAAAGGFLLYASLSGMGQEEDRAALRARLAVAALVLAQWVAGVVNIVLLAPVWMQLFHLFLANVLWLALVLFFVQTRRHGEV